MPPIPSPLHAKGQGKDSQSKGMDAQSLQQLFGDNPLIRWHLQFQKPLLDAKYMFFHSSASPALARPDSPTHRASNSRPPLSAKRL